MRPRWVLPGDSPLWSWGGCCQTRWETWDLRLGSVASAFGCVFLNSGGNPNACHLELLLEKHAPSFLVPVTWGTCVTEICQRSGDISDGCFSNFLCFSLICLCEQSIYWKVTAMQKVRELWNTVTGIYLATDLSLIFFFPMMDWQNVWGYVDLQYIFIPFLSLSSTPKQDCFGARGAGEGVGKGGSLMNNVFQLK